MYRWYRDAFVCIVHLAESSSVEDFVQEPWFTRGWTLQELLAPERLRIYGKDWKPICPKSKEVRGRNDFPFPNDKLSDFMLHAISKVTDIHILNLRDFNSRSPRLMVSTKMRWASKRKTTRIEDTAYSLLGIFDITMSIAYGEGDKAFLRFLEAIAQRSGDPSFFAWAGPCSRYSLALPASPASYQTVISKPCCEHGYTIQKRGIHLRLIVILVQVVPSTHYYTLRPLQPYGDIKILGQFACSSMSELNLEHSYYAIGVVDFQLQSWKYKWGFILPGKRHFGIFMRVTQLTVSRGITDLLCRRIDTKGILPLIECESKYMCGLEDVILVHSQSVLV